MTRRRRLILAAVVGVVSAAVVLAVAEVVSLFVAPGASPIVAVGGLAIDLAPAWVKDVAIALFYTADKIALLVLLGLLVVALAAGIGVLHLVRPPWGFAGVAAVALVASLAATTRAEATGAWALPSVVGAVVGVLVLHYGIRRLRGWTEAPPLTEGVSRRAFIGYIVATAGAATLVGVAARMVNATTATVSRLRDAITIPAPTVPAAPIPAGAELGIDGLARVVTPNVDFYRIDTALQVPSVNADEWRLRVTGMVEQEVEIGFDELLALPLIETAVTLTCVSNEVGGGLIGNAVWVGYPIRELLKRARPLAGADMVLSRSIDGFTASTPLPVLQDDRDAILAVAMNGDPLPLEHGFPVRMVVPGLYGYVSATKWVTELELTTFEDQTAYWTDRGWSERGPIKTSSRIDVPAQNAAVDAVPVVVAGVAWAQHTGIDAVEVRVDGGPWQEATLADAISVDTWRQWRWEWDAEPGSHTIEVRATDADGETQSGAEVGTVPDGAEGWHRVEVGVR